MASALRVTVLSIMAATLGACGHGGGGGGGSGTPTQIPPAPAPDQTPAPNQTPANQTPANQTPAPDQNAQQQNTPPDNAPRTDVTFSSFAAVEPSQNVRMFGEDRSINGTQLSDGTVRPITTNTEGERGATLWLGFDSKRSLAAVAVRDFTDDVAFDRSKGHSISCSGGTCTASSPTASAVVADAFANGWNYQTYGVWTTQSNPTSVAFGAVSAGVPTPGNAVPTTGLASFSGRASGYYIDPAGATFNTDATLTANVDFQQRFIAFNTGNTTLVNTGTGAKSANTGLNMTGTLNWDAGFNRFSGSVQTANDNLSGSASGKFYGPKAEEIGGTYNLVSGPTSRMIGGFGGKR